MNNFIKYSFIITFIGSIAYMLYHLSSIDPQYKKEISYILKERRSVIEDQCKFMTDFDKRFTCFKESALRLRPKLKNKDAIINAQNMYDSLLELKLNTNQKTSASFKEFQEKMTQVLESTYSLEQ